MTIRNSVHQNATRVGWVTLTFWACVIGYGLYHFGYIYPQAAAGAQAAAGDPHSDEMVRAECLAEHPGSDLCRLIRHRHLHLTATQ